MKLIFLQSRLHRLGPFQRSVKGGKSMKPMPVPILPDIAIFLDEYPADDLARFMCDRNESCSDGPGL
jgi:hypothetical protein